MARHLSLISRVSPIARAAAAFGMTLGLAVAVAPCADAGGLAENVDILATWDAREDYRTVVGHATGGITLAIVGTGSGTAFVNVTTPAAPVEVGFVPGPPGHRTVAASGNVAYAAGESGGLQIISLASPTNPTLSTTLDDFTQASHLFIDRDDDVLFAGGTEQGLLGYDISSPLAPVGIFDPVGPYAVVAGVARRPLAYVATGTSLAILDISNPPGTRLFTWATYPGAVSTSTELSSDRTRVLVTDARPGGGGLRVYDVENPAVVGLVSETTHTTMPTAGALAVSWAEPLAYVAWGSAGLEILEMTDDTTPARVGAYASAADDAAGIVSVFARTASGLAYALDGTGGLAILSHTSPFGEITGLVTDTTTEGPAAGIEVSVPTAGRRTVTGIDGRYTIAVEPGAHEVVVDAFRYEVVTALVSVAAGEGVTRDLSLDRRPFGTLRGTVSLEMRGASAETSAEVSADGGTGGGASRHPEGTIVRVLGTPVIFPAGFSGFYVIPGLPAGTYVVEADRFGHDAQQFEVTVTAGGDTTQDFFLARAPFADNLESDTGWSTGAPGDDATSGTWGRLEPVGTGAGYVQPEKDETPDPDSTAFVTGNGPDGGWIDVADVDGGTTTVLSPLFDLTGVVEPIFRYYRWFSNDATWEGESYDGDALTLDVSTDGGATWTTLETMTSSALYWQQADFVLSRHVTPTDAVRFRVRVTDGGMPSIVEAAFDDVEIWSGAGLVTLPPVPIEVGSVEVVSAAPGTVTLRWLAPGRYDAFDIERAGDDGAPVVVGTVPGTSGDRYAFTDRTAPPGRMARYWIVGRGAAGIERAGPFLVWVIGAGPRSVVLAAAPNPSGGPVTLRVEIADERGERRAVRVSLRLFDAAGRHLATLLDGKRRPGRVTIAWDGRDARGRALPSGVYWYRLETPGGASVGRVVRMR